MPVLVMPEAPTKTKTPEEELRELEEEALSLGMSPIELAQIQAIGRCQAQILQRIAILRFWISRKKAA